MRQTPASAKIYGNLLDGIIRQRQGGQVKLEFNEIASMGNIFKGPDELGLEWNKPPENIPSTSMVPDDFCGVSRPDGTRPGSFSLKFECD